MFQNTKKAFYLTLLCLTLSGCGIKPNTLKAPEQESAQEFPAVYPAEETLKDD